MPQKPNAEAEVKASKKSKHAVAAPAPTPLPSPSIVTLALDEDNSVHKNSKSSGLTTSAVIDADADAIENAYANASANANAYANSNPITDASSNADAEADTGTVNISMQSPQLKQDLEGLKKSISVGSVSGGWSCAAETMCAKYSAWALDYVAMHSDEADTLQTRGRIFHFSLMLCSALMAVLVALFGAVQINLGGSAGNTTGPRVSDIVSVLSALPAALTTIYNEMGFSTRRAEHLRQQRDWNDIYVCLQEVLTLEAESRPPWPTFVNKFTHMIQEAQNKSNVIISRSVRLARGRNTRSNPPPPICCP